MEGKEASRTPLPLCFWGKNFWHPLVESSNCPQNRFEWGGGESFVRFRPQPVTVDALTATRSHAAICQRVVCLNIHTLRCHMYTVLELMETWVASSNPARSIFVCCILSYVTDGTYDGPVPILHK